MLEHKHILIRATVKKPPVQIDGIKAWIRNLVNDYVVNTLDKEVINDITNLGSKKVDYIELLNSDTLNQIKSKKEKFRIFIAYYLNNIRLIDNV